MTRLQVTLLVIVTIIAIAAIAVGSSAWNDDRQGDLPYVNTTDTSTTSGGICIHPTGLIEHNCP
jgi:hypothetical protein